ncbi:hypothetical protein QAD02_016776 [Eretmocerus hayati]|uniref:Uncharacterized protein n=1 Tax=Eretmocerus hayati TaxID=131215 RepID=A0ACC2PEI5_9HYME|nr:hypothetical protein QAD02_016776 [Eretmocerus hayati]
MEHRLFRIVFGIIVSGLCVGLYQPPTLRGLRTSWIIIRLLEFGELNNHLVTCHRYPARSHCCTSCPSAYAWRPLLVRHRAIAHGDVRNYPCENCPKVFTDPSNLQRHIRRHHVGARSHACTECGKTFATSSGLKQHTHIHSSVKPFQCEVCFKAYTQFSNLCRHKRMHIKCRTQITCAKCKARFSTVTSLTKHKRFCDSTSVPPTPTPPPSLSQSQGSLSSTSPSSTRVGPLLPPASTMPQPQPNPFFFPRQPISFYPPGFMNPYSASLFRGAASNLLGLPMLFPTKPADDHKVSPSAAEEASSDLRPSPARPQQADELSMSSRKQRSQRSLSPASSDGGPDTKEQPLDLRVQTKRQAPEPDSAAESESETNGPSKSKSKYSPPPATRSTPDEAHKPKQQQPRPSSSAPKHDQHQPHKIERPSSESRAITSPPGSTSGPNQAQRPSSREQPKLHHTQQPTQHLQQQLQERTSPLAGPTPPHMAYPRPVHPLFLESMYRGPTANPFPGFPGPGTGADHHRLLQPLPGFGAGRGLPFLGPLMNSLGPGPRAGSGYDVLARPSLGGFPGMKPFQESIMAAAAAAQSQHQGGPGGPFPGKIKDRYSCKFCGKNFPRSANLTRHLRTHTGEQPYKCKYCERSFSISSNLQRHVRNIHDKQRPFKCPMCERCFGQQTNLDRHLKKHEADDGSGIASVADSADSSNENEREEMSTYFDEIRSLVSKVNPGYGSDVLYPGLGPHHSIGAPTTNMGAYLPSSGLQHAARDFSSMKKYDADEDDLDSEERISPLGELSPPGRSLGMTSPPHFDLKLSTKRELLNNNTAEPVIEIST